MKKIPTLYERDRETHKVTDEVVFGCEWVLAGEGVATRKYDGTCVMFDGADWWARREVKKDKRPPDDFKPEGFDEATGKRMGWVPIASSSFAKFHQEALEMVDQADWEPGTYELCGPKVNGNPEGFGAHMLVSHAYADAFRFGQKPAELIDFCRQTGLEGVVWHHPDGRMAKLKVKDYA